MKAETEIENLLVRFYRDHGNAYLGFGTLFHCKLVRELCFVLIDTP